MDVENPSDISLGAGSPFAIADFDGDLRPDLASVQSSQSNCVSIDYSIQLQLSTFGRQWIRLVAPSGGLQIEARDVNGDHAVDLVVSAGWHRQPVAIFLNDGHGSFSRVEPAAFPGAFSESSGGWASSSNLAMDAIGVASQSGVSICGAEKDPLHDRSPAGLIPASSAGFRFSSFLVSHAGRAPPSEVHHS